MNFKLEREIELRKKHEEAATMFKQQNEKLNEQFEMEMRNREKIDKAKAKTEAELEDLNQRLEQGKIDQL